jgi:hypothetical protein
VILDEHIEGNGSVKGHQWSECVSDGVCDGGELGREVVQDRRLREHETTMDPSSHSSPHQTTYTPSPAYSKLSDDPTDVVKVGPRCVLEHASWLGGNETGVSSGVPSPGLFVPSPLLCCRP